VDLSLSEENVEVLRGEARPGPAGRLAAFIVRRRVAVGAVLAGLLVLLVVARSRHSSAAAPDRAETAAAAAPDVIEAPAPPSSSLVTIEPTPDGASAHHAMDLTRPPSAPRRAGKAPARAAGSKATHPPSEDDDRIE
jgi:hypothetical protein